MQHAIEGDWYLLDTCNYRCGYCFSPEAVLSKKLQTYGTAEQWARAYTSTGLTWLLHLTGGEPSVYPDFADFCAALTRDHYISFNSNLSRKSVQQLAQRVDPSRVSFINAGLHFAERQNRQGFDIFRENLEVLQRGGFPVFVSIVATPGVLAQMEEITALLADTGCVPVPKVLRGQFEGQIYPADYSDLDRRRFKEASRNARRAYGTRLSAWDKGRTINVFSDDRFLRAIPSYKGRSCSAGKDFVGIGPDGGVYRCNRSEPLGSILEGTFRPTPAAKVCDTNYCFYFCEKYSTPPPRERLRRAWAELTA